MSAESKLPPPLKASELTEEARGRIIKEILSDHARELAELIRRAPFSDLSADWDRWDAATSPGRCADLIIQRW